MKDFNFEIEMKQILSFKVNAENRQEALKKMQRFIDFNLNEDDFLYCDNSDNYTYNDMPMEMIDGTQKYSYRIINS